MLMRSSWEKSLKSPDNYILCGFRVFLSSEVKVTAKV